MEPLLAQWKEELSEELTRDILPFWLAFLGDGERFAGRIDGRGTPHPEAGIGAVLTARMLWTFSAAYRATGCSAYRTAADRARAFLTKHLIDPTYGGVFWEVAPGGTQPRSDKKQSYALGFAIYGLSAYARATGDPEALRQATELFEALERHAFDPARGGYVEALTRDWQPLDDMRLSDKDTNARFSMNTHLHLLEPYTLLLRVWPDRRVAEAVRRLIRIHTERLFDPTTGHLGLFFDADWQPLGRTVSYGHDIEASWLLDEAVEAVEATGPADPAAADAAARLADAALEGLQPDGSLAYEYDPRTGHLDAERHWWVQAEAVVGCFNRYVRTGDARWLERSHRVWQYIRTHLLDTAGGEWFWSIRPDGTVNRDDDKAGFWKCPYHNGRMCLELMARIGRMNDTERLAPPAPQNAKP